MPKVIEGHEDNISYRPLAYWNTALCTLDKWIGYIQSIGLQTVAEGTKY